MQLSEGHLRIDELLPDYDFTVAHNIRINAPSSVVYECLFGLDFNEVWLVRLLETARTGKLPKRSYWPTRSSLSERVDYPKWRQRATILPKSTKSNLKK